MDTNEQIQINSGEMSTTGKLLNVQEREICEKLSGGEAPYRQWAQTLLAIDGGASQAEAAQRSGLTNNQVRYWLAKFRKLGLGIFPQQSLVSTMPDISDLDMPVVEEQVKAASEEVEDAEVVDEGEAKEKETTLTSKVKKLKEKKKGKQGKDKGKKKGGKKGKAKRGKKQKKSKNAGSKQNKNKKKKR